MRCKNILEKPVHLFIRIFNVYSSSISTTLGANFPFFEAVLEAFFFKLLQKACYVFHTFHHTQIGFFLCRLHFREEIDVARHYKIRHPTCQYKHFSTISTGRIIGIILADTFFMFKWSNINCHTLFSIRYKFQQRLYQVSWEFSQFAALFLRLSFSRQNKKNISNVNEDYGCADLFTEGFKANSVDVWRMRTSAIVAPLSLFSSHTSYNFLL